MPIYEYLCDDCGVRYERIVLSANGAATVTCPKCSSSRQTLQLSVISKPGKSGGGSDSPAVGGCMQGTCGCRD